MYASCRYICVYLHNNIIDGGDLREETKQKKKHRKTFMCDLQK